MSNKAIGGRWLLDKKLGSGSFASVFLGHDIKNSTIQVAIKAISRRNLSVKLESHLQKEVRILEEISHDNIVRLFETHESKNHIYLVMEFCAGGDLHKLLKKYGRFDTTVTRRLMTHLAQGMYYLWSRNLIHRDLKPQNLLLDGPFPETAVLKIADFGFATQLSAAMMAHTLCGSPLYMAPEILDAKEYDAKADLWSAGAIFYEMLVGTTPFRGNSPQELLRNIHKSPLIFPDYLETANDCIDLLQKMLQKDPRNRIAYQDFAEHPFFKGSIEPSPASQVQSESDSDSISLPHSLGSSSEMNEPAILTEFTPKSREDTWEMVESESVAIKSPITVVDEVSVIRYICEVSNRIEVVGNIGETLALGHVKNETQELFLEHVDFGDANKRLIGCVLLTKGVSILYDSLKLSRDLSIGDDSVSAAGKITIAEIRTKYTKFLELAKRCIAVTKPDSVPCAENLFLDIAIQLSRASINVMHRQARDPLLVMAESFVELLCDRRNFQIEDDTKIKGVLALIKLQRVQLKQ